MRQIDIFSDPYPARKSNFNKKNIPNIRNMKSYKKGYMRSNISLHAHIKFNNNENLLRKRKFHFA